MHKQKFLMSDNWWIDGEYAYFCSAEVGALFQVDMHTGQCVFLDWIPECEHIKYRVNSYSQKYKDKLFCFAYEQNKISVYDLNRKTWEKIEVNYNGKIIICKDVDQKENKQIWMLENIENKIIQLDTAKQEVTCEYSILQNGAVYNGQYVLVCGKLYFIMGNKVGCINLENHLCQKYEIVEEGIRLYTICYDGSNFWLSGEREEIYIWNPMHGVVNTIKDFLTGYSVSAFVKAAVELHVPLFNSSILIGDYIWYTPIQANAPIIYVNKNDCKVHILEIADEEETFETIGERTSAYKYIVEYVRQGRYIGIYSVKNQNIFEIDTVRRCSKEKEYELSNETKIILAKEYYNKRQILFEGKVEQKVFASLLKADTIAQGESREPKKGKFIYNMLNNADNNK